MQPSRHSTGYQVKPQYKRFLPKVSGRPDNYVLTPYCLPSYNPMYTKIMQELHSTDTNEQSYAGFFNQTLF